MCHFLADDNAEPGCVRLEIEAAGGQLFAAVRPPPGEPEIVTFNHVPLLRAVKMAELMANVLRTDVAIVDPLGIWHEWLVEWASTPVNVEDSAAAH
jgi:hypothetical protein